MSETLSGRCRYARIQERIERYGKSIEIKTDAGFMNTWKRHAIECLETLHRRKSTLNCSFYWHVLS